MTTLAEIEKLRKEYATTGLDRAQLNENPFTQFEVWFEQAIATGMSEPNAMVVATASANAAPSQRTVLLKSYDEHGFVFYTNYASRKAQQLKQNDQVSLLFPWIALHRQVIVEGTASKVSAAESLKYFTSRPRGSQLGAWASAQSSVIAGRSMLESKLKEITRQFADGDISLPEFWGGYRIKPQRIEFWQGRDHRLHDRFLFERDEDEKGWEISRLSP